MSAHQASPKQGAGTDKVSIMRSRFGVLAGLGGLGIIGMILAVVFAGPTGNSGLQTVSLPVITQADYHTLETAEDEPDHEVGPGQCVPGDQILKDRQNEPDGDDFKPDGYDYDPDSESTLFSDWRNWIGNNGDRDCVKAMVTFANDNAEFAHVDTAGELVIQLSKRGKLRTVGEVTNGEGLVQLNTYYDGREVKEWKNKKYTNDTLMVFETDKDGKIIRDENGVPKALFKFACGNGQLPPRTVAAAKEKEIERIKATTTSTTSSTTSSSSSSTTTTTSTTGTTTTTSVSPPPPVTTTTTTEPPCATPEPKPTPEPGHTVEPFGECGWTQVPVTTTTTTTVPPTSTTTTTPPTSSKTDQVLSCKLNGHPVANQVDGSCPNPNGSVQGGQNNGTSGIDVNAHASVSPGPVAGMSSANPPVIQSATVEDDGSVKVTNQVGAPA